ncbi:MAG: ABC transporter permease [Verrucomicrobiae bacterium]|nr:ABC transporter permease [Verrucomicrobiae bacterium]MCP5539869.1 ABC transporter permease [Akkermansiaceae bacterium]MCP5551899.1 ABC transporter permease [Akkermansiaceae bacterium]
MKSRLRIPGVLTALVLVFLYFPILVLVLNSFNASKYGSSWEGWTLRWYRLLFSGESRDIWESIQRSLHIAIGASLVSMVLGTTAAWVLHRYRTRLQKVHFGLVYLPIVAPDILMGISLGILLITLGVDRSLETITVAHITFCISYVALAVLGRLQDFDESVVDAARDLGATWWQAVWRVVIPLLAPGIVAGGLLAFTLSIDDFVITFFVKGVGLDTLPLKIYSMARHSRQMPVINALSTLMLTFTFVVVWYVQRHARPALRG